jgi:farnesyl-diphosphate farnesyltransferase
MLNGVSRSFAFTIPQLPESLRIIVANSYLLFRIADSIEDENALSIDQKRYFFQQLIELVSDNASPVKFTNELYPLLTDHTPEPERELIRNTDRVIHITRSFNEKQREILRRGVMLMSTGMERFQENKNPQGLRSLTDLNDYCYYVAGVVGELLTELFCDYSEAIFKNRTTLLRLAVSFGQGLQMTNILKDLWEDRDRGACWLPQDVFLKNGFDLKDLSKDRYCNTFWEGVSELIGIAHAHLKNALAYTLLIPRSERGIRKFCLWSIGMAVLTLKKINKKRNFTSGGEVKVSRRTVKGIILSTRLSLRSNLLLKMLFYLSTRGLPLCSLTQP